MATSNVCRSCARALRSSQKATTPVIQRQQTRQHHPSSLLYLDFLAPSWRSSQRITTSRQPSKPQAYPRIQSRTFTQTSRAPSETIPTVNPRKDDNNLTRTITITPRAAQRLRKIATTDSNPNLALRVSVESGGCHGFQYLMSLISTSEIDAEADSVFEDTETGEEGYKAKVVMDEASLELLSGSSIDYSMELIGSQFKVVGIPGAKSSCGCGTSFDIA